jgi:aspartyl-tRNA(Asn)/glutamyl-tRNA(Gln) amidotransferase subunit C
MDRDKVLDLAKLARIKIDESEAESLSHEFDAILKYVGEVKSLTQDSRIKNKEEFSVRNVMREDGEPHASGIYTEDILNNAPERKDNYLKVKKIL